MATGGGRQPTFRTARAQRTVRPHTLDTHFWSLGYSWGQQLQSLGYTLSPPLGGRLGGQHIKEARNARLNDAADTRMPFAKGEAGAGELYITLAAVDGSAFPSGARVKRRFVITGPSENGPRNRHENRVRATNTRPHCTTRPLPCRHRGPGGGGANKSYMTGAASGPQSCTLDTLWK